MAWENKKAFRYEYSQNYGKNKQNCLATIRFKVKILLLAYGKFVCDCFSN